MFPSPLAGRLRGSVRRASGLVLTAKPYLCRTVCKPSIHLSGIASYQQLKQELVNTEAFFGELKRFLRIESLKSSFN
jgi:hypothetical protein